MQAPGRPVYAAGSCPLRQIVEHVETRRTRVLMRGQGSGCGRNPILPWRAAEIQPSVSAENRDGDDRGCEHERTQRQP